MSLPKHPAPAPHTDPLVASAVRAAAGAAPGHDCPDAELLGLYAERELGHVEHARVDAHVRDCARCQAIVAAFVRTMPEAAAVPAGEERVRGGGFACWFAGWRWLVPAASLTAVAVVAVWVGRGPADEVAQPSLADNSVQPRMIERQVPRPQQQVASSSELTEAGRRADSRTAAPPAAMGLEPRVGGASSAASAPPADRRESFRGIGTPPPAAPAATERMAKAAPPAEVRTESAGLIAEDAARAADRAAPARESAARGAAANPDAPAPAAIAPAAPAASAIGARPTVGANFAFVPWRATGGGVERSTDGGHTWQRVALPAGVTVVAASSPGGDVCWAVSVDAVLATTDGRTWTRRTPPSPEALADVAASSAAIATVTTSSGARFRTSDGGATWAPLR